MTSPRAAYVHCVDRMVGGESVTRAWRLVPRNDRMPVLRLLRDLVVEWQRRSYSIFRMRGPVTVTAGTSALSTDDPRADRVMTRLYYFLRSRGVFRRVSRSSYTLARSDGRRTAV